ncbi:MAG: pilin [Candidatus Saccharimonadales bacterium]
MRKTNIIISAFIALFVTVSVAAPAHALFGGARKEVCKGANLDSTDGACKSDEAANSVEKTIANVVNLLSIIVGIAAVILIIVNGLKLVTSGGDSNSISAARNGIIYAIVGLIIVALAQVIVRFVLSKATPA